jgi:hypothetical protein
MIYIDYFKKYLYFRYFRNKAEKYRVGCSIVDYFLRARRRRRWGL